MVVLFALLSASVRDDPAPWSNVRWGADRGEVQRSIAGLRVPETIFLQGVLGQQLGLEGDARLAQVDVFVRYYFTKEGGLAVIKVVPADERGCEAFRRAAEQTYGSAYSTETTAPSVPSDMGSIRRTWTTDHRIITHIDILGVPWLQERCNITLHAPDFDRRGLPNNASNKDRS